MPKKSLVLLVGLLALLRAAPACNAAPSRPKVGLALAGGGARGLAHVGVLQWFEEHHIPVDYVAGTSMGGVVGGLFASGRSSAEILEFVNDIDWLDVLRSSPAYSELSFRRKEDQRAYPNAIEFGWKQGVRFPSGLNAGHKVGLMLDRIAFPYSSIASFDDLPTPFRCIAVDLVRMDEVVLEKGSFSRALRATMSIPGIFAPVKEGNATLVDGGLLNNLPADVVQSMGADVVIAVDLGAPAAKDLEFESFFGALGRSIDVMIRANVRRNLKLADIVLQPDLQSYETFSFEFQRAIIEQGYQAAAREAERLGAFALDAPRWEQYLRERSRRRRGGPTQPAFLAIEGVVPQDRPAVESLLKAHVSAPLDFKALGASLTRITGWGRYDVAGYSQRGQPQNEGLGVRVRSKAYGPPFLKPSIEVNGAQIDDVRFTLAARLTSYDLLDTNSEWRTDLSFGFRDLAATEFYQPLGRTGLFVAPRVFASRRGQFLYVGGRRTGDYAIDDQAFGLDLGYTTGVSHEIRFGYQLGQQRGRSRIGSSEAPTLKGRLSALSAGWQIESVNDPIVPTQGIRFQARGQWFLSSPGATSKFPQAEARLLAAHPVRPRLSAFFAARGGSTFGKQASFLQKFTLGGPLQLGATRLQELRGDHYFYSSIGCIRLLSENLGGIVEKVSAIAAYEIGDAFDLRADPRHDATAGILSQTRFGVLFFGGSLGEGGRGKIFFSLGGFF